MKFWNFKKVENANPQLFVYGEISDWWGVDSKEFTRELNAIEDDEIDVRINSDGGSVFTAQAIHSSLKRHKAKVNVYIDGMAASAATIIAMAGDTIYMPENAMMMIHNPLTWTSGNANELRETADLLDKVRETLISVYRNKTGLEDDKIIELLDNETYLTAEEAKDYGFIDVIEGAMNIAASLNNDKFVINGVKFEASRHKDLIKSMAIQPKPEVKNKEPLKMDLETLKKQHPDLVAKLIENAEKEAKEIGIKEGIDAENARIAAIEALAIPGYEDVIAAAKEDKTITAEKLAVQLITAQKEAAEEKKVNFLANREQDAASAAGVKPSIVASEEEKVKAGGVDIGAIIARRASEINKRPKGGN